MTHSYRPSLEARRKWRDLTAEHLRDLAAADVKSLADEAIFELERAISWQRQEICNLREFSAGNAWIAFPKLRQYVDYLEKQLAESRRLQEGVVCAMRQRYVLGECYDLGQALYVLFDGLEHHSSVSAIWDEPEAEGVGMSYWVYESWGADGRSATIHDGHCGFCKEGRGRSGRGTKAENGRWLGPSSSLADSRIVATALSAKVQEHRCCRAQAPLRQLGAQLRAAGLTPPPPSLSLPPVGLSLWLTRLFTTGDLDLSARTAQVPVGWQGLPEVPAATRLRAAGATERQVRYFLTFTCALDRARDAGQLWAASTELFLAQPQFYEPRHVSMHRRELGAALREFKVSQRHGPDLEAWLTLAETLAAPDLASAVRFAIEEGAGDAGHLLYWRLETGPSGAARYPMLRGPKIGPLWVRVLAHPGGARLSSLEQLPVAVDVQVRRVTECLGAATTKGMPLEAARPLIQAAWRRDVLAFGAEGPAGLENTCAALDPALWFFGKHGCGHCESVGRRVPIADVCEHCRADLSAA